MSPTNPWQGAATSTVFPAVEMDEAHSVALPPLQRGGVVTYNAQQMGQTSIQVQGGSECEVCGQLAAELWV